MGIGLAIMVRSERAIENRARFVLELGNPGRFRLDRF